MNSEDSQHVLVTAALQILDKIDPTIFPSFISSIADDDESTLLQLFTNFEEQGMFKSLLIEASLRSLVTIQISGAQKSDKNTSQTIAVTDFHAKLQSYRTYFASIASIKFIFCQQKHMPPKVFNCPIHGHIKLSCLSVKVMDTPQFQRLRDISQLGSICYVFGGAASKRFEHSLGVAHLARTFVRKLQTQQPELRISEVDALCVELAGLCHDLGHGPFSHLFDGTILPMMGAPSSFCHEHASIGIFDLLIHENDLLPIFSSCGLGLDDVHFIKELILGDAHEAPEGFEWRGRGDKTFLYDIVANKRNGVDVDRFDYFRRDCHLLGLKVCFDDARLMEFARVHYVNRNVNQVDGIDKIGNEKDIEKTKEIKNGKEFSTPKKLDSFLEFQSVVSATATSSSASTSNTNPNENTMQKNKKEKRINGGLEISFHIKEAWNIFDLFHTRYALHKRAYHHPVSDAIDLMVAEAMVLADRHVFVPGIDRRPTRMSECVGDMHAYARLGEYLFKMIEHSFEPELQASRDVINRIRKRDIFVCASETLLSPQDCKILGTNPSRIKEEILQFKRKNYTKKADMKIENNHSNKGNEGSEYSENCQKLKSSHNGGLKTSDEAETLLYDQISKLEEKDIFCRVFKMGFGKGKENPVTNSTSFFRPDKITEKDLETNAGTSVTYTEGIVHPMNCSRLIPTEFEETYLRMFCRHKNQSTAVSRLYTRWCEAKDVKIEEVLTPHKKRKVDSTEA